MRDRHRAHPHADAGPTEHPRGDPVPARPDPSLSVARPGTGRRIASIGHSDLAADVFFRRLADHGVRTLVDVRSHPVSHVAHFDQAPLARLTAAHGVSYHHLPGLGGKRAEPYTDYMGTASWADAYARLVGFALEALADGHTAAFLCVERDPADCHRRFIAARLATDGWTVRHILYDGRQTVLF